MTKNNDKLVSELTKIRHILDNHFSRPQKSVDWNTANAFMWKSEDKSFKPVENVNAIPLELLKGIDNNIDLLFENTNNFSNSLPANNALLWGSRGMGKSSLVKGVHAKISSTSKNKLILIEIHREDIKDLPDILNELKQSSKVNFIVFCDDLSFDNDDTTYKSLKTALEGGIEGRPKNVIFYATSNRRHLMARQMIENETSTAINPSEAIEEKVSLSDRFGLWIGFHNCSQEQYLSMIQAYARHYNIPVKEDELTSEAIAWAAGRGSRSGRVAWQFITDLAAKHKINIY
ncbi:MAG: ATP-binding protein [Alphaproteobacteria bacterium]|nr:ATP-binding protein [Alphaproteobacteria bacterium]